MRNVVLALTAAVGVLACSVDVHAQQDPPELPDEAAKDPQTAAPAEPECCQRLRQDLEVLRPLINAEKNNPGLLQQLVGTPARLNDFVTQQQHNQDVQNLTNLITQNANQITTLSGLAQNHDDKLKELEDRIADNDEKLEAIVTQDGEGDYVLAIEKALKPEQPRRQLEQALTRLSDGVVWIYNPYRWHHLIYINGTRWRAVPGWSYVWVPRERVSVTHIGGGTPKSRNSWQFDDKEQLWEIAYRIDRPWR